VQSEIIWLYEVLNAFRAFLLSDNFKLGAHLSACVFDPTVYVNVSLLVMQLGGEDCPTSSVIMNLSTMTVRRFYSEQLAPRPTPRRFLYDLICALTAGENRYSYLWVDWKNRT